MLRNTTGKGVGAETPVVSCGKHPWVCIAHGIRILSDGKIDWCWSDTVGYVSDINKACGSVDALLEELGF